MAETIVTGRRHGLPYSKGLMAQSLSASGLTPERAYVLAQTIEQRLADRGEPRIEVADLRALAADVLREQEGDTAVRRFLDWERVDRLERPLIVLLAGAPGVGKSTLATMLAHRMGVTRVIATDAVRQVIRAFFSEEFMPAVHFSSFEAGRTMDPAEVGSADPDLAGFVRQAESVRTGVEAIVARAIQEQQPMVLEGVHLVPGTLREDLRARCIAVPAVVTVSDEELHRGHFSLRGAERPASRYLDRFEQIRKLQAHLVERAEAAGVPVVDNVNLDLALTQTMDLVLDAVAAAAPSAENATSGAQKR
jgi:2-phosphoglycerate kinase